MNGGTTARRRVGPAACAAWRVLQNGKSRQGASPRGGQHGSQESGTQKGIGSPSSSSRAAPEAARARSEGRQGVTGCAGRARRSARRFFRASVSARFLSPGDGVALRGGIRICNGERSCRLAVLRVSYAYLRISVSCVSEGFRGMDDRIRGACGQALSRMRRRIVARSFQYVVRTQGRGLVCERLRLPQGRQG